MTSTINQRATVCRTRYIKSVILSLCPLSCPCQKKHLLPMCLSRIRLHGTTDSHERGFGPHPSSPVDTGGTEQCPDALMSSYLSFHLVIADLAEPTQVEKRSDSIVLVGEKEVVCVDLSDARFTWAEHIGDKMQHLLNPPHPFFRSCATSSNPVLTVRDYPAIPPVPLTLTVHHLHQNL